jgi:enoyl-CoA hydratase
MGLARQLADGPQLAIRWTKQALNKQLWEKTVQLGEYGGALEQMSFQHRDHDEAARAFVEKRDPKFPATIN